MSRGARLAWALVLGFVTGGAGGPAVGPPDPVTQLVYTVAFAVGSVPVLYRALGRNWSRWGDADRPARVVFYFLALFVVTVVLATLVRLVTPPGSAAAVLGRVVAFAAAVAVAAWFAIGEGMDLLWDRLTGRYAE